MDGSISMSSCLSDRFVLLKERNMLLTTLQAYEDATEQMPNEERIDKVGKHAHMTSANTPPLVPIEYPFVYVQKKQTQPST